MFNKKLYYLSLNAKILHIFLSLIIVISICWSIVDAGDALFNVLDQDDNGYITLDETQDNIAVRMRFNRLDKDQNSRLSELEFSRLNEPLRFEDIDVNDDLYISYEEAMEVPELKSEFIYLDTNNDQKISPKEYQ